MAVAAAAAAMGAIWPGKGMSAARRGLPMGAADVPSRVAARSSSLGY
jgi:hypothetical protein